MNVSFQLASIGLLMLAMLASGILWVCRGQGECMNDSVREALLWGGGFLLYAVIDYLILMH